MAFEPKKQSATDFHGGVKYENQKDGVEAETINNLIEGLLFAQENGGSGGGSVDQALIDQVNANKQEIERLSPIVEENEYGLTQVAMMTSQLMRDVSEQEIAIIDHDNYLNFLKKVLPQSGVYGEATVEEAFHIRPTASGLSVVNDYPCVVKKIQGGTVVDSNGKFRNASFQKIVSTGKNILRPLSQRVYRSMGATANTTPRDWDGKTCSYSMTSNGYYKNQLSACSVDKNNETITSDFQSDAYGFVIDFPCQEGLWYTISLKDTENRARVLVGFYDKDGLPIANGGASSNWYCRQAPENAVWGVFVITNRTEAIGKTTTYSEFMVEVSAEKKTEPSEYVPFVETEYGNGNVYELPAYDYIDVERQVIVRNTGKYEDGAMDGWDGTVESGDLSIGSDGFFESGGEIESSSYVRTPYIPVKGSRVVYISGFNGNYKLFYYDSNDGSLGKYAGENVKEYGFDPSSQYMRLVFEVGNVPSKGKLKVLYQLGDEIAQFKNAIVNTNSTQLVYELDEATETPISINNTYTAYNHGSETVEQGTGDNATALCTLTIEYTSLGVIE